MAHIQTYINTHAPILAKCHTNTNSGVWTEAYKKQQEHEASILLIRSRPEPALYKPEFAGVYGGKVHTECECDHNC